MTYPGGPTRRSSDGAGFDAAGFDASGKAFDPWAGGGPRTVGFPVPRPSVDRQLDRELHLARDGGWRPGAADRRARRAPWAQATGPIAEPEWWSYGSTADPGHPMSGRHSTPDDDFGDRRAYRSDDGPAELPLSHPSAPLPPRPAGVWDRLRPREDGHQEDGNADLPHRFSKLQGRIRPSGSAEPLPVLLPEPLLRPPPEPLFRPPPPEITGTVPPVLVFTS